MKASQGDLLQDYHNCVNQFTHLVVMPVARLFLEQLPLTFPNDVTFYPNGYVQIDNLHVIKNRNSSSLAEVASLMSGVDENVINLHPIVVFPLQFDWQQFLAYGHRQNMEFIRSLSDHVDRKCFNFIRYRQCSLFTNGDPIHNLPGRAGQINTNHMMAGALLYNHFDREARIIGGDAFTHIITRGLGLSLESIDHSEFPSHGEVGSIVGHALLLYTAMLEANNPTSFFVQALSLLEFLADPNEYRKFEEVKKIIARYVAKNAVDYDALLNRFRELTSKQEDITGRQIGYRTLIIHMGKRLEDIVTDIEQRRSIFLELDKCIRSIIDHMIIHSEFKFDNYLKIRNELQPFKK